MFLLGLKDTLSHTGETMAERIESKYEDIINAIINIFSDDPMPTISIIKKKVLDMYSINESVFDDIIHYLLSKGFIEIIKQSRKLDQTTIILIVFV